MDLKEYDAAGIVRLIKTYLSDNGISGFSAGTRAVQWNNGNEEVEIRIGTMSIDKKHLRAGLIGCYLKIHGHLKTHTVNIDGIDSYDDMSPTIETFLTDNRSNSETSKTSVIENKDQLEKVLDEIIVATPDITKMLKKALKLLEVIESNTHK